LKLPLWSNYRIPFESALTAEDARLGAKVAYANLLRVGTTCFADAGGSHPDEMGMAALELGIRGIIALSTLDDCPIVPAEAVMSTDKAIKANIDLVERWSEHGQGLVKAWLSLRQITVCTPTLWREFALLAAELGCRVHTHLAEGTYEVDWTGERFGMRPAQWLDSIGVMGPQLHAAHSILLSDAEVGLLGRTGTSVAHCPTGAFGIGAPKVPALRRAGVAVGLGTDGASNGSLDLFAAMRASKVGLNSAFGTPWHHQDEIHDLELIRMATIEGARALGMGDEIGSLEPGKKADLIVVRTDPFDAAPVQDPVFNLTHCATGRDVVHVVVNGRLVMESGVLTTVDEAELAQQLAVRNPVIQGEFERMVGLGGK
jgi:5-methylthioadenosine/S-adenosylhomocysteine deaminase